MHHRERTVGRSGYTLKSLIDTWVTGALSFSPVPLRASMYAGVLLFLISVIGMIVAAIIHKFYVGLFWGFGVLVSFQLIAIGLLGEYVSKVFFAEMEYPQYVVRQVFQRCEEDNE